LAIRFTVGEWTVAPELNSLQRDGQICRVEPKIMQVLVVLVEHSGDVVSKEQIFQRVWPGTFVSDEVLTRSVSELRRVFGDNPREPKYIQTIPKGGYRLVAPVIGAGIAGRGASPRPWWRREGRPILAAVVAVLLLVTYLVLFRDRAKVGFKPAITSLAVLPLTNLSGDPSQDYFADGMTDELITDLGQISALRVISRTSVMQYKGTHKTLPEIARELNVDAVVEGTVLRSGDRVRITAQLVHAPSDRHLWAQSYEGDLRNVLAVQNDVAKAVAEHIEAKLTNQERTKLEGKRVLNPDAYEAYLKGMAQDWTVDGSQRRIEYLEKAIALQADYADAYAGLADAYVNLGHMLAGPPQLTFSKAKIAALKALELDGTSAQAHAALGDVTYLYDWDFPGAEKEIQRTIQLNPNSVSAHASYADFLNLMGRYRESIDEARRRQRIDPLSLSAATQIAVELYGARRYDECIEQTRRVLASNPNSHGARLYLGLALEQKNDFPEAIAELNKAVELSNDKMWIGFVAYAKARSGDKTGARRIVRELELISNRSYVSPWWLAMIYFGLGERDQALFWLEKSYEGREHDLVFSNVWPMFDSLRSDPQFKDILRRVGLPPSGSEIASK
jgi:TolB-like protein/DNA-binding winged helix-turn-helix (wHTH) protein